MAGEQRYGGRLVALIAFLALLLLATACASTASSSATKSTVSSKLAVRPDAQGRHYGGNPDAALVVEEWSDLE